MPKIQNNLITKILNFSQKQRSLSELLIIFLGFVVKTEEYSKMSNLSILIWIFKEKDCCSVKNYRFVSLINNIFQIFVFAVFNWLYFQLENVVFEFKHGYMTSRSTATNLCVFTEHMCRPMEFTVAFL